MRNRARITTWFIDLIKTNLFYDTLKNKLQSDNSWTDTTFGWIDWEAFHAAIVSVPPTHRISITKISHQLWNTNKQNSKFYNQSALCPICTNCIEDTNHIYYCTLDSAFRNRLKAQQTLRVELETSNTPGPMIAQLLWCLTEENTSSSRSNQDKPSIPSQIMEEQQLIGWSSLLRGLASKKWGDLYQSYLPSTVKDASKKTRGWMRKLILSFWGYSKALWKHRNEVVHGAQTHATSLKELNSLQRRVRHRYRAFENDKYIVHASASHLFSRPMSNIQQMSRDAMVAWLASVQEAIDRQRYFNEKEAKGNSSS